MCGKYRGAAHCISNRKYAVVSSSNKNDYEVKIDTKTNKQTKKANIGIKPNIKFIDTFRFVTISLFSLTDNLSQKFHEKVSSCESFPEYGKVKDNFLIYNCIKCEKYRVFKFNER